MSASRDKARFGGLSTSASLPDDILGESRRRLRWACSIYTVGFLLGYGAPRLLFAGERVGYDRSVSDAVALASIAVALGVAMWLRPSRKLSGGVFFTVGLAFEVVSSFGIAAAEYWAYFNPEHVARAPGMHGISWVCVWIVVLAALVPANWRQAVPATLLAAASSPLVLLGSLLYFDPVVPEEMQVGATFTVMAVANATSAAMALAVSQLVHGLTRKVREARKLGAYQLVDRIGQGGMGEVWRAEHRLLARPAAVKLVRAQALETGDPTSAQRVLRRFEREAQATAQLRCPHTISLYDFGISDDGTFYYVMELLEGVTLETLVEKYGPQPAERVVHLMRQVCASLDEAHQRGLVHRDIKPANIFCCRYGLDLDFVKVLDFGLVKQASDLGPTATRLTADGAAAGTPAYMAPETIVGDERVDFRADLYTVGCVAYWLLTGHLVFEASTPMRMALMHVDQEPLAPSALAELDVPAELDALLLDCLAKKPADRPQTAGEIVARLDGVPLAKPWTKERAADWWLKHQPQESSTGAFVSRSSNPVGLEATEPAT